MNSEQKVAFAKELITEIDTKRALKKVDNKKLVWLLINTKLYGDSYGIGTESSILDEICDRLFPEWCEDDNIRITDTGWEINGERIDYL